MGARIARESAALRRVVHPNIQRLLDSGTTSDGMPFLVTHFEAGETLERVIATHRRVPERWIRAMLTQLLAALDAVHSAGAAHGDVTPTNCVCVGFESVDVPCRLCLIDFGGARWLDGKLEAHTTGTSVYMAPELATGSPSIATDLYAVGIIAYEMLVGVPPFRASTNTEVHWQHAHEPVRLPRESDPQISPTLEAAVLRALEKDPAQRFGSATEFAAALDAAAEASEQQTEPHTRPERADQDERAILLQRVREQWIEGVLARTTDGVVLVRQRLTASPTDASLRGVTSIVEAYSASDGGLLILGDPGHGKTVNLLRLARHAADHATNAQGTIGKVPVVLTLSSWTVQDADLAVWIRRELASKYLLTTRSALRLIESDALLPMLDGLDDVRPTARDACVRAINTFRGQRASRRIVVSCRTDEYAATATKLGLKHAVVLESLASHDIAQQLEHSASSDLAHALQRNPLLGELSHTPMLLHVMRVAFRDSFRFRGALASEDDAVHQLFESFVSSALRKLATNERTHFEGTISAVARTLSRTSRILLLFEEVQPSWLGSDDERMLYAFVSRAAVALTFCLSIVPAVAFSPLSNHGFHVSTAFALRLAIVGTLGLGSVFGIRAARSFRAPDTDRRPLGGVLTFMLGAALIGACMFATERNPIASVMGVEVGVVGGLLLGVSRRRRGTASGDVGTAERISWSLRNVRLQQVVVLFTIATAVFALASFLDGGRSAGYMAWAVIAIGIAILGHHSRNAATRVTPNVGIWDTARNATLVASAVFVVTTFSFGLSYGVPYGACVGVALATIGGLWFGGIDVMNHVILRWLLHRRGALPLDALRSLDAAVDLGLMRRTGNGYLFMHAMLLRHLEAKP